MIDLRNIAYKHEESLYQEIDEGNIAEFKEKIRRQNLTNSIQIDKLLFPEIATAVTDVKEKLSLNHDIQAYVRNDSEMQAMCFAGDGDTIEIALTSGLIQIYEPAELRFVIGHEIAHHLYEHFRLPKINEYTSRIEELNIHALSRAAEITADRIGCIAADIDTSLMAIVKLASGLPSAYIRKDFTSYLKQARQVHQEAYNPETLLSSHPSCPTRLRALICFSMSAPYYDSIGKNQQAPLSRDQLNKKVSKDLSTISGFKLDSINENEFNESIKWGVFHIFSSDGKLSKVEQSFLKQILSEDDINEGLRELKNEGPQKIKDNFYTSLRNLKYCDLEIRQELCNRLTEFLDITDGDKKLAQDVIIQSQTLLLK